MISLHVLCLIVLFNANKDIRELDVMVMNEPWNGNSITTFTAILPQANVKEFGKEIFTKYRNNHLLSSIRNCVFMISLNFEWIV